MTDIERASLLRTANELEQNLFNHYGYADRAVADQHFYERKQAIQDLRKRARE